MQDERKSIGDWKSVDDVIDSIRAGEFPGLAKDYDIEGGLARLVFDLWM